MTDFCTNNLQNSKIYSKVNLDKPAEACSRPPWVLSWVAPTTSLCYWQVRLGGEEVGYVLPEKSGHVENEHFSLKAVSVKLNFRIKSNLSILSLYYTEACNEFTGPISASLHPGNTAPSKKSRSSGDWRAVGNTVSDLTKDLPLMMIPFIWGKQTVGFYRFSIS